MSTRIFLSISPAFGQSLGQVKLINALIKDQNLEALSGIIKDELNVKKVLIERIGDQTNEERRADTAATGFKSQDGGSVDIVLDTTITPELKQEGLVRDLIRQIQNKRKEAGLEVDDRIELELGSDAKEIVEAIKAFDQLIKQETLATSLKTGAKSDSVPVRIDGQDVTIELKKAA